MNSHLNQFMKTLQTVYFFNLRKIFFTTANLGNPFVWTSGFQKTLFMRELVAYSKYGTISTGFIEA
jgi:hypothetical protein